MWCAAATAGAAEAAAVVAAAGIAANGAALATVGEVVPAGTVCVLATPDAGGTTAAGYVVVCGAGPQHSLPQCSQPH